MDTTEIGYKQVLTALQGIRIAINRLAYNWEMLGGCKKALEAERPVASESDFAHVKETVKELQESYFGFMEAVDAAQRDIRDHLHVLHLAFDTNVAVWLEPGLVVHHDHANSIWSYRKNDIQWMKVDDIERCIYVDGNKYKY